MELNLALIRLAINSPITFVGALWLYIKSPLAVICGWSAFVIPSSKGTQAEAGNAID